MQFFFLSAHFWLNAMNFNVWKGLREIKQIGGPVGGGGSSERNRKFRAYAAYAWVSPTLMLIVTLIMQVSRTPPAAVSMIVLLLLLLLLLLLPLLLMTMLLLLLLLLL